MRKLILLLSIAVYGCTPVQVVQVVKDFGCVTITKESRKDIRSKQDIKTNICRDDIE